MLRNMGLIVTEAATGPEALAVLKRDGGFDLMLADVVLPGGMSGPQTAEKVREIQPDLPVIFMSGYAGSQDDATDPPIAPEPLLKKPFSKAELQRHLAIWQSHPNVRERG
jgi:CheY-like chemotaxis protein